MQLERKGNLGQQAGGIRRTFHAPGKDEEKASNQQDSKFIEDFKNESLSRGLKEGNVNDFAHQLTRLSNALIKKTGRGIVHRGLDDPALDKAARGLDGLFSSPCERALKCARTNERFRLKNKSELSAYEDDKALIGSFIDRAPTLYESTSAKDIELALRNFSTWLRSQNLPSVNQLLSQDARLKANMKTYLSVYPQRTKKIKYAINTVKGMGLTVTRERNAGSSQPFSNASSHSWPDWDQGGPSSINLPYGDEGFGNTPGSDFFKGLPWEQPQTPSGSVNQPHDEYGVSESYPPGYYLPWSPPLPSQAYDPYSSTGNEPSALNPRRPEIGNLVGTNWHHGNQSASDALISVLSNQGLAPYQYMPQTEFDIYGERYRAVLQSGQREPNAYNPFGLDITLYHVPRGG
ncbi:hypothetical protein EVC45_44350 [Paraburkholderia sp. UYCP14C]|uniref:hypothetical protein n=1 Tax=Paraburkholderia sp. UYCP14C TaxID=2511130 RepID=UPI001022251F|nr:hypothetical protein [Paraburkholderia sp. UYCP14C]RZF23472.1 hypothetical protein EVC45_44350 [Paraburkholderia sp. UYCP14C]